MMSYYDIGMISGLTVSADIRFDDIILISECRYHIMSADIGATSPCYQGLSDFWRAKKSEYTLSIEGSTLDQTFNRGEL